MSDTTLIDARLFRSTMGRFATGVTVVTVSHLVVRAGSES